MGSVLNGIGSVVGGIGGGVAQGAGATSQFQAGNQQLLSQQQDLAKALQAQMAGQGPNPAQTQYQANVDNNIANAQGLISSQRGLNPALAARMGANQAAVGNQHAALGSALLQQQQQLNATRELGNLYGQEQQGALGAQQINAQTAGQNAAIRGQLAGGILGAAGGIGASMLSSGGGASAAGAGGGGSLMAGGAGDAGGLSSAAILAAHGGVIPSHPQAPLSMFAYPEPVTTEDNVMAGGAKDKGTLEKNTVNAARGGAINFKPGGQVPGKASVSGDSLKNDTVPAMLSPGEIVVPRSISHDPEKAKDFIDHLLKKEKKSSDASYGDVLKARRKRKAA